MVNYKIFISYSNDDKQKMHSLSKFMKKNGSFIPVVVANRRNAGMPLADKVAENIRNSDILLPILTENAIKNQWVNQEIGYAKAINKTIVPIVNTSIINNLKGFITSHIDLPYLFESDPSSSRRDGILFSKCYRTLLDDLKHGKLQIYTSKITSTNHNNIPKLPVFNYVTGHGSSNPNVTTLSLTAVNTGGTVEIASIVNLSDFKLTISPDRFLQENKEVRFTFMGPPNRLETKEIPFDINYLLTDENPMKASYIYYPDQHYIKSI